MAMTPPCVIAIDAGTTGVRSRAVRPGGGPVVAAYREFTQHFPQPGWVEHDARGDLGGRRGHPHRGDRTVGGQNVAAIGITNQRETTVLAWNRRTGEPTAQRHRLARPPHRRALRRSRPPTATLPMIRERTGLVLDPYFSGSKMEWLLANRDIPVDDDLAIGTIDTWLIWNLTGGEVHATDPSNASRTMLFDIRTLAWSPEMCALFGVPISRCCPRCALQRPLRRHRRGCRGVPAGVPISGIAGDQQAALFGQACFAPWHGQEHLRHRQLHPAECRRRLPAPAEGMLTTVAWTLADGRHRLARWRGRSSSPALPCSGCATGWASSPPPPRSARWPQSVADSGGVYVVPAFTGLGSPWWDPYARGTIVGITRGTTKAHIARAVVEAMTYQTRDAVEAMCRAAGVTIRDLRVDGGASVMDVMLQMQADQLGVTVRRPADQETTALGAAYLAGLAEGVWPSLAAIADEWSVDADLRHPSPTARSPTSPTPPGSAPSRCALQTGLPALASALSVPHMTHAPILTPADSADAVLAHMRPHSDIVVVPLGAGEPLALMDAIEGAAAAGSLEGVTVHQMHALHDRPSLHGAYPDRLRHVAYFLSPVTRPCYLAGTVDLVPNHFSEVYGHITHRTNDPLVVASASPPDRHGYFSLGLNADYTSSFIGRARFFLEVNPRMPRTFGRNQIHMQPGRGLGPERARPRRGAPAGDGRQRPHHRRLRRRPHPRRRVPADGHRRDPQRDHDGALAHHRDLGVHTELLSDGLVDLVEKGVVNGVRKLHNRTKVVGTFARLGTQRPVRLPATRTRPSSCGAPAT